MVRTERTEECVVYTYFAVLSLRACPVGFLGLMCRTAADPGVGVELPGGPHARTCSTVERPLDRCYTVRIAHTWLDRSLIALAAGVRPCD